ncbi:MAG TPA: hypothetical protein VKZ97_03780 [Flavobacteriaceae bacterium]|nr:hypothetical protein [Flavobacteriaceae bacterium]
MKLFVLIFALTFFTMNAQDTLPYAKLPDYPENYTAGTVAARMVDGLGFRFYWATEGLGESDLVYKFNEEARSTGETIRHIYDLSNVILFSVLKQPNQKIDVSDKSDEEVRKLALMNLKKASEILTKTDDLSQITIDFGNGRVFPFWNAINGPIADAIWHCGQIASFRRNSGNPISSKVNHFTGTIKE